ncbi:MAG: flagellar basal body P-ring protein FlgI [bacterium]|nr:flagellar basal body P-ring protein FlgI [bacterium]
MIQRVVAFTIGIILGIILFRSIASAEEPSIESFSMSPSVRLKDLCRISDVRPNQLTGYGLIIGLNKTGDGKNTFFTAQSIVNMLQHFGVTVDKDKMKVNAIAAVMVTAELPAFSRIGDRIDVTVSALGDASDLSGGVLLQTPLSGADKVIYAVAQGPVSMGGGDAGGKGGKKKAHPTVGRVIEGGIVEKEITCPIIINGKLPIVLKHSDFTTVARMVEAIDANFGAGCATGIDSSKIDVSVPSEYTNNVVGFISLLESLSITPDVVARVVINERTGTVVIGENLCILPVAVSHKDLYLVVSGEEEEQVVKTEAPTIIVSAPEIGTETMAKALGSIKITPTPEQIAMVLDVIKQQQAAAASQTEQSQTTGTETTPASAPSAETEGSIAGGSSKGVLEAKPVQAASQSHGRVVVLATRVKVGDVVKGLSAVGATPQDVIAVLQAIKAAGALQAEIVVM